MPTVWSYPTRIVFGVGTAREVGAEAVGQGIHRALVVSDPGVKAAGLLDGIVASLEASGIATSVFSDVASNPTEANVEAGAQAFGAAKADGLVAVGGGSPLDVAKLIAVRAATDRPFEELDDAIGGDKLIPSDLAPSLALPTTAGTGSEVGRAGVLTVESTQRKTVIFHPAMLPKVAILDPDLTRKLPAHITAATGFDALTHCLEAYLAKGDHPMADGIALGGLELCAQYLARAVNDGDDMQARGAMMKAAMMGAVAFQKGLGACHSLAHPLGSECNLHHGLANALCLPVVVEFNASVVPERVARVQHIFAEALGDPASLPEQLRKLRRQIGLPEGLVAAGVAQSKLERLADLAIEDGCHAGNPRDCTRDDLLTLYRASL